MKTTLSFLILLVLIAGCKERYNPPVSSPQTGYLVVEGYINNGAEPTTITLSRTTPLQGSNGTVYETGAQVTIEGNNGESYPLNQSNVGVYTSASLTLNPDALYRLHIIAGNGREYASDYTPVLPSPPIDSLSWQRNNSGLQIYVNSHDPQNTAKYFQWQYVETWEFHSAYASVLTYTRDPGTNLVTALDYWDPILHSQNTAIYTCWHTVPSTNIILGSTDKLTTGLIHLPLINIPQGDQKLSVLYHIRLQQIALSSGKYQFLQRMKKNTETLGSIFDAQPSELNTNLHCLSDSTEQVIGFVEVTEGREKTLFINNNELPDWNYNAGCPIYKVANNLDVINSEAAGLYPTSVASLLNLSIKDFYASDPPCVDCTLTGSNVKPSFWP